jgi:hypothetical protein
LDPQPQNKTRKQDQKKRCQGTDEVVEIMDAIGVEVMDAIGVEIMDAIGVEVLDATGVLGTRVGGGVVLGRITAITRTTRTCPATTGPLGSLTRPTT